MARGRRTPLMNFEARVFPIDPIDWDDTARRFALPFAFYEGQGGDGTCISVEASIDDDTMVVTGYGTGGTAKA